MFLDTLKKSLKLPVEKSAENRNQMFCINNNQKIHNLKQETVSVKIDEEARINNIRDNKLRLLWECKMRPYRKHLDSFLVTALKMSLPLIQ